MAGGMGTALRSLFRTLAGDTAKSMEDSGKSIADFTGQTADTAENNANRISAIDDALAEKFGDIPGSIAKNGIASDLRKRSFISRLINPPDVAGVAELENYHWSVTDYDRNTSKTINSYLWDPGRHPDDMGLKIQRHADQMSAALRVFSPKPGTTYRAVDLSPEDLAKYQEGETVTHPGFTNTTEERLTDIPRPTRLRPPKDANEYNYNPATDMIGSWEPRYEGNTKMIITGHSGRDVTEHTLSRLWNLTVYDKGTQFKVTKKYFDPATERTVIHLQQVG